MWSLNGCERSWLCRKHRSLPEFSFHRKKKGVLKWNEFALQCISLWKKTSHSCLIIILRIVCFICLDIVFVNTRILLFSLTFLFCTYWSVDFLFPPGLTCKFYLLSLVNMVSNEWYSSFCLRSFMANIEIPDLHLLRWII